LRANPEALTAFRRAVDEPSTCPRCGSTFTGALCPTLDCVEGAAGAGPLTWRVSMDLSAVIEHGSPPGRPHHLRDHEALARRRS
jgi:hypothetical protein